MKVLEESPAQPNESRSSVSVAVSRQESRVRGAVGPWGRGAVGPWGVRGMVEPMAASASTGLVCYERQQRAAIFQDLLNSFPLKLTLEE